MTKLWRGDARRTYVAPVMIDKVLVLIQQLKCGDESYSYATTKPPISCHNSDIARRDNSVSKRILKRSSAVRRRGGRAGQGHFDRLTGAVYSSTGLQCLRRRRHGGGEAAADAAQIAVAQDLRE